MIRISGENTSLVVGSGFFALDVVYEGARAAPQRVMAGGSATNVLAILSYLGWRSVPIGRIGDDQAGDLLVADLEKCGVVVAQLHRARNVQTPVVVHRVYEAGTSAARHRFEWRCPSCGSYLPRYRPVTIALAERAMSTVPRPDVYFFDRADPGPLRLAKCFKDAGALIVFEPSSTGGKFDESVAIADVVKCSVQRVSCDALPPDKNDLQVVTDGERGLQFRLKNAENWNCLSAPQASSLVDAAGAGDWCTAGLIYGLQELGAVAGGIAAGEAVAALHLGQILGAFAVQSAGARGAMYDLTPGELRTVVREALRDLAPLEMTYDSRRTAPTAVRSGDFCMSCQRSDVGSKASVG